MTITHQVDIPAQTMNVAVGEGFSFVEVQTFLQQVEEQLSVLQRVCFDMSEVRVLDSAALAQLVYIYRQLHRSAPNLQLELNRCSETVRRLLEIGRLDELFHLA